MCDASFAVWILHLWEKIRYYLFPMTLRRHQAPVLRNFCPISGDDKVLDEQP
jgi:hypothetical protein